MASAVRNQRNGRPQRAARGRNRQAANGRTIEIDEDARAIRVHDPQLINSDERAFCRRLIEAVARRPGVSRVEVDLPSASCLVEFGSGRATSREMADVFAGCVGEAVAGASSKRTWGTDPTWLTLSAYPLSGKRLLAAGGQPVPMQDGSSVIEVATGARRVMYLALAGGAFTMTLVGLVLPGVPTVPFLLMTSYCLARSSPALNARLRQSTFFGPIIVEWEQQGGLSRSSKRKLMGLTVAIGVVALIVSPLTPFAVIAVLLVSALGIYGISLLPGLPDEERAAAAHERTVRFALPAP
jgi:uncharacterized membrane protein YbaN (DUF454 family)